MALATAGSDRTTTTSEVIDQGPSWTFRFSAQGRSGGEVRVTRGELEASNWTVVISDEVIDTLSRAGAPVPA